MKKSTSMDSTTTTTTIIYILNNHPKNCITTTPKIASQPPATVRKIKIGYTIITPPILKAPKKRSRFVSSSSLEQNVEHAKSRLKMEDNQQQLYHHHQPTTSRLGSRNTGGEIVEVQGGHIVRSIGRKARHSKVCTTKGPRDRRVRLSTHTAIQFYDVQDRLGYDRPSKAVDWLIKKAKAAIDELEELPPWNPSSTSNLNLD